MSKQHKHNQGAASRAGGHGKRRGVRVRIAQWWHNPSIMRAFFGYAAVWLVVATLTTMVGITLAMEVNERVAEQAHSDRQDVVSGPYIYDETTDELVAASQVYLNDDANSVVFVGFTEDPLVNRPVDVIVAGEWDAGSQVVNATMELLRNDDAYQLSDWGGNYTDEMYYASDGNPYEELGTIAVDDLAAYDARQRAERVRTDQLFAQGELGDGVLVSNVGYYVSYNEMAHLTPLEFVLRGTAGLMPFVCYGGFALLFFMRFYRRYIKEPLGALGAAAERIAGQDLDGSVESVRGRELGQLAQTMESMRASLLAAQRELWRTAEDRRRLNAAFAHDLRTPVTVLKGTLEMARMKFARADGGATTPNAEETLDTLANQVERLETYAQLMSRVSKLEDREVVRQEHAAAEVVEALEKQATGYVASRGNGCELHVTLGDRLRAAVREPERAEQLQIDVQLVEEALGNVLSNACSHARKRVTTRAELRDAGDAALADGSGSSSDGFGSRADGPRFGTEAQVGQGPWLELVITDDGHGFTAEALHRGCDPFYSEAKSAEHFGLGLNIAQTLARLHGGTVELGNLDGGGARVTVTFAVGPEGKAHDESD